MDGSSTKSYLCHRIPSLQIRFLPVQDSSLTTKIYVATLDFYLVKFIIDKTQDLEKSQYSSQNWCFGDDLLQALFISLARLLFHCLHSNLPYWDAEGLKGIPAYMVCQLKQSNLWQCPLASRQIQTAYPVFPGSFGIGLFDWLKSF